MLVVVGVVFTTSPEILPVLVAQAVVALVEIQQMVLLAQPILAVGVVVLLVAATLAVTEVLAL
jgi:hypothetical protein